MSVEEIAEVIGHHRPLEVKFPQINTTPGNMCTEYVVNPNVGVCTCGEWVTAGHAFDLHLAEAVVSAAGRSEI